MRLRVVSSLLCATALLAARPAGAGCRPEDPQGRFRGRAEVGHAPLEIALELECAAGRYRGALRVGAERLPLEAGSFDLGELHLRFLATPAATLEAQRAGPGLAGSFRRGNLAGRLALEPDTAGPPTLRLSAHEWREDLDFLAAELSRRSPAPERPQIHARVRAAIAGLERRLARADPDELYVALAQLTSELGVPPALAPPADEARLPIELRDTAGAFRVIAATDGNERALGARLVAIDGVPIAGVERRLLPLSADRALSSLLVRGLFLHGAGVAKARESVRYTLRDDKGTFTLTLRALAPDASPAWSSVAANAPLFRQRAQEPFWCEELPELGVLYCRLRDDAALEEGSARMQSLLDARRPDALALDLRLAEHVDPELGQRALVDPLLARRWLDRKGQLFVLIGPGTSAAGATLAVRLRARTAALLVGEPAAARPVARAGDALVLPRSHLVFHVLSAARAPASARPDVAVPTRWADVVAGRDPVLDWVIRHARHP